MPFVALEVLLTTFGALAFILLALQISQSLSSQQGGIVGFIIKVTTAPVAAILQLSFKIIRTMAPTAAQSQQRVGVALSDAASLVTETAGVIEAQAAITADLTQALAGTATAADLAIERAKLGQRISNAEQQARGIGADVQPRIEAAIQGIGADVNQRIASLDREIGRIATVDLPGIRGRARTAENELSSLWKWVHRNIAAVGTLTFAGAVAIALSRLGGGWIRCRNWNRIGKSVCGLPLGIIEAILGDLIDVLLIADVCEITKLMIRVAESSIAQDALRGIILGVDELMLCQGVSLPPPLGGYTAALPPAQPFSLLPAA